MFERRLPLQYVLIWILALSACSDSGQPEVDHVEKGDRREQTPERALVRGNYMEPVSLDPHKVQAYEIYILLDLHEGLVNLSPSGEIVPGVAERWETEDNRVYRFYLRPDARWSNGDPVTAGDFVYSWRRLVTPAVASPYASYLEDARIQNAAAVISGKLPPEQLGIKALDDHTLEVSLDQPLGYFVEMLTLHVTFPVHRPTVETFGDEWTRPEHHVSNGAFRLLESQANSHVTLVASPSYWDADNVQLQKVTFLPIESPQAEMNRYLAGDMDITAQVPSNHLERLGDQRPRELQVFPLAGMQYLTFNTRQPPFDNTALRKALSYAIDREILAEKIVGLEELASYTYTPASLLPTLRDEIPLATMGQAAREAQARALYAQAGYSAENPLKFEVLFPSGDNKRKEALAVAAMWKRVLGAEVTLRSLRAKDRLQQVQSGNFQVSFSVWLADYQDGASMLGQLHSDSSLNLSGYNSPRFDQLLETSAGLSDADARKLGYLEAERVLAEDVPVTPLYQYAAIQLVSERVGGYAFSPTFLMYSKNLWIKDEALSE
ncbi:peptide ABC transporter substrate-binding protein [Microbulbifer guangxiensis]|uniref:peptide ABC transporter substrate-binding protein n=1 Tax=Microbulbifer guangxiensis TaxID=2904249 RepID=UPI001F24322A|nr:peptide ABC transporter substrate-binding protein [Microbulbifer guangxiensis]